MYFYYVIYEMLFESTCRDCCL